MSADQHFLEQQQREVSAWRQVRLHNHILSETRKISSVTRADHRAMLHILIAEAMRQDPNRDANRPQWAELLRAVEATARQGASILSIAPDPYAGLIAKLSSMRLWTPDQTRFALGYYGDDLETLKARQAELLARLEEQGALFLAA